LLRDEQNKARQELWNWSNSLEDNGGSALMLASMTGTARQTLMGYLMPKEDDQPETLTEDNITAIVKGFKKPEKNKKKGTAEKRPGWKHPGLYNYVSLYGLQGLRQGNEATIGCYSKLRGDDRTQNYKK